MRKRLTKKQKKLKHQKTKGYLKKRYKSDLKKKIREARKLVIERDNHQCQVCKALGKIERLTGHNCQVHHIIPKTFCKKEFEPLLYDKKNMILLCFRHHHIDPVISPHMNAVAFCEFLREYHLDLYDYALAYTQVPINHIHLLTLK